MNVNFDIKKDRHNTDSIKWDYTSQIFGVNDPLPFWVADMDFSVPEAVLDALRKRVDHGIFGYTAAGDSFYSALQSWMERRHGWKVHRDWIVNVQGIVPAIHYMIQELTGPGDGIVIQKPVYYPFMTSIKKNGRTIVNNPLVLSKGKYRIDFDDLEEKLKESRPAMMLFCSPHNPVGRVWEREELEGVAALCCEYDVILVSDEIHHDLILEGRDHIPMANISNPQDLKLITCVSPSKTFNLAGLQAASLIIENEDMREGLRRFIERLGIHDPNVFGLTAIEAAYREGEAWLEELLVYLQDNVTLVRTFLKDRIPEVTLIEPEGTYLLWLDFRGTDIPHEEITERLRQKESVVLHDGMIFGKEEGRGFHRLNIACPRTLLSEGLERIARALQ